MDLADIEKLKTEEEFQAALDLKLVQLQKVKSEFGEASVQYSWDNSLVAQLYSKLGNPEKAYEHEKESLRIILEIAGPSHGAVAISKHMIATYERELKEKNINAAKEAIKNGDGKLCSFCMKIVEKKMNCSRCKKAFYCNVDCQRKDWKAHKKLCVAAAAELGKKDE